MARTKKTAKKNGNTTRAKAVTERGPNTNKALVIVKDVKGNPRREGTFGFESFGLIRSGMTVEKFVEAGGRMKDLHWDIQHGHCHLSKKA